jgi:hypothetical protein
MRKRLLSDLKVCFALKLRDDRRFAGQRQANPAICLLVIVVAVVKTETGAILLGTGLFVVLRKIVREVFHRENAATKDKC